MKGLIAVFLQTLALAASLAIFSTGASVASSTPLRTIPAVQDKQDKQEETVYITNSGKKFHRDGCRYLSHPKIAIKRRDAIAQGYEPGKVCRP